MAANRLSTCSSPDLPTMISGAAGAVRRPAAPLVAILALAALAACVAPPDPSGSRPFRAPGDPVDPNAVLVPVLSPAAAAERILSAAPRLAPSRGIPTAESDPTGDELAFVGAILSELQLRSFAENREYCGYIGLDAGDTLVATPAMPGSEAMCPLPPVPRDVRLVASFHTHGTYSPLYASEWPTTQDMVTDASDDIDGYISTPGGRLWHVDSDTMTARELCGRGCLPQDPAYIAAEDGPLRPVLTYRDLLAWELGL
jgi:hypothetical protein